MPQPLRPSVLKLADICTEYGQLTGFKELLPAPTVVSKREVFRYLEKLIPRHCAGITLDIGQAQKLLEDAQIVPTMVDALKFRLLFQRATFLQTKLFEDIPNQADKVFPQAKLDRLDRELHP